MLFSTVMTIALLGFGAAQAASSDDYQIKAVVTDAGLDMSTPAGQEAFSHRIKAAALNVCMQSQGVDNSSAAEYLLDSCVRRAVKAAEPATVADLGAAKPARTAASFWAFSWLTKRSTTD
jgi:UrcA family protein